MKLVEKLRNLKLVRKWLMPDLGGHDSMVAVDTLWWLAKTAASLNKHTFFSYSNSFNEGLPWRASCGYEDGVHGVVSHPFTHIFIMENHRNVMAFEVVLRSNSAEQKQLGGTDCTSRYNYFAIFFVVQKCLVVPAIFISELDSNGPWLQASCIRNDVSENGTYWLQFLVFLFFVFQ